MDKTVAIFGGSFNPVTNAHLSLAELIACQYASRVIFLPVGDHYNKDDLLESKHRVKMLKMICKSNKRFSVSEIEVNSKVLLYTIDSLNILKEKYPDHKLIYVMGSDNLKYFTKWKQYETLLKDFKFLVMKRDNDNPLNIINSDPVLSKYIDSFILAVENIKNEGSATYIRNLIRSGKSVRYLVPDKVYYYIEKHNLYKKKGDLNE